MELNVLAISAIAVSLGVLFLLVSILFVWDYFGVVGRVARSKNADLLARKAKTENINVLTMIAANPNTPGHVLDGLANNRYFIDECSYVLRNPNTSTETLKRIQKTVPATERRTHAILEEMRIKRVNQYIQKNNEQFLTQLVGETFMGWDDDLKQTIASIHANTHKQH